MTDVIIDCDPGVDDALALMLAVASPELQLLGVTCVAGNRPLATTADNACRVLDLTGRPDVEVFAGCSRPLAYGEPRCNLVHGEDGLAGVVLPAHRQPSTLHGVDFLEHHLLERDAGELVLVGLGPPTNLALAEIRHPGVLRRARAVVLMGGAAFCDGNVTPSAEFNFHADALAAQVVLGCGAAIRLFGLDVTRQAEVDAAWIDSLATGGGRCGHAARAMLQAFSRPRPLLHDACPIAWLLAPDLFAAQPCQVDVDWRPGLTEGHLAARRTAAAGAGGTAGQADVFTTVRAEDLRELLRSRIVALP